MTKKSLQMAKTLSPDDPAILVSLKKVTDENKKRFAKSKRAAVDMLKSEGILTKSGRVAAKYR